MMNSWFNAPNIATMLAEDAGAPELRNPMNSGMRAAGRRSRLFTSRQKGRGRDSVMACPARLTSAAERSAAGIPVGFGLYRL